MTQGSYLLSLSGGHAHGHGAYSCYDLQALSPSDTYDCMDSATCIRSTGEKLEACSQSLTNEQ